MGNGKRRTKKHYIGTSKEEPKLITCDKFPNKTRYPSLKQANCSIRTTLKHISGIRAYYCDYCKGYHLTSK